MKDNFTLKLLKYWRNSLADAEKADINKLEEKVKSGEAIKIPNSELPNGQINAELASKLISSQKDRDNHKWNGYEIKVLICPIAAVPIQPSGKPDSTKNPIRPIWIPAKLNSDGHLSFLRDDPPWIPRVLLEPLAKNSETIGTLEAVEVFLGTHPFPSTLNAQVNWRDIWRYSDEMLQAVTGQTIDDFSWDGYEVLPDSYIVLDKPRIAWALIRFYDQLHKEIEKGRPVPPLLQRYTSLDDIQDVRFLTEEEQIEQSAAHLGQMNQRFSLSPSQREAIHHALTMEEGEILAVNGPPGNGKTTLIESVVASLWVEAALRKDGEPPVIVAASTNNQAVTNVINSFGKTGQEEDDSPLSGRWIPGITSYGLYCPAPSKQEQAEAVKFQRSMQKKGEDEERSRSYAGFYLARGAVIGSSPNQDINIEEEDFINSAEEYFLKHFKEYADRDLDLRMAVSYLHERLLDVASEIRTGPKVWNQLERIRKHVISTYGSEGVDAHLVRLNHALEQYHSRMMNLKQVRKGWAEHIDRAPWWVHFMNFVPRFLDFFFKQARKSVAAYNKRFLSEIGCKIEGDLADPGTIEDFFDCQEHGLEEKQQKLLLELRRTEFDRSRIVKTTLEWEDWRAKNDLQGEPPELLGLMDTKLRYLAFKLATHYWEGQWLLEMEERFDWKRRGSQEISKQKERWRRYAKLTPCIVLTFHMLEWFFNAYGYTADGEKDYVPLYEFIDLLVIDEAGQVSPDLAGANFALARKALVVGDTKQLKPIHNIIPGIDRANIKKHGLASSEKEIRAIDEAGFSVSEPYYSGIPGGNVMKIAQRATRYKNPEYLERGMFLREHYRCVPEIIAFCNELAYGGMLEPQRKCDPEYPLPRIGYLHVPGNPRKLGSSWVNEDEAQAIARWIVKYRKMVEFHPDYINKPIGEIIAVLTPFKAQEKKIKKALERSGFDGITVGTVHVLQGAERPVILYSSVYGPGDILYMMNHEINLLNVAVSRAKDSFLVFGNMQIFKPLEAPLPTGILARHLYEKDTNRLIDDEIIGLQHEQQMVLSATHSINGGSLQRQSSIRLFISYAHADEVFLQELNNHLSGLQRQGIIHDWHDRRIVPGQNRDDQISTALNAAQIILLLISSHFMADDYCYAEEMTRALQRHDAGEVIVIPIILRHFDLQGTPFSNLQALPKNGKPITSWRDRDEAWTDVVKGLRHTINMLSGRM